MFGPLNIIELAHTTRNSLSLLLLFDHIWKSTIAQPHQPTTNSAGDDLYAGECDIGNQ